MKATAPRWLAITDGRRGCNPAWWQRLSELGVALQVRERGLEDRALEGHVRAIRRHFGSSLLVNARADVALAAGADGVHLPSTGLPVAAVSRHYGDELLIGVSTHCLEEVESAARDGADYVVLGPIFPTPSKPATSATLGAGVLREASGLGVPVLALGGIDSSQRAEEVLAAGAYGIAGIRWFRDRLETEVAPLIARHRGTRRLAADHGC